MKIIKLFITQLINYILDISTGAFGFVCIIGASNIGTFCAGLILLLISFGFYIKDRRVTND